MQLQSDFEPFAKQLFTPLCILARNSKMAMSQPADNCMTEICDAVPLRSLSVVLKEGATSTSDVTRRCCVKYASIAVQRWPVEFLQQFTTSMEQMLKITIVDASPAVRSVSRQCFADSWTLWPERMQTLFRALPNRAKAHIRTEHATINAWCISQGMEELAAKENARPAVGGVLAHIQAMKKRKAIGDDGSSGVKKAKTAGPVKPWLQKRPVNGGAGAKPGRAKSFIKRQKALLAKSANTAGQNGAAFEIVL